MSEHRDFEKKLARLRERMNQLLIDASSEIEQPEPMGAVDWVPPADILENKDDIVVKIDIPGVNPDDIDLSISGYVLHIKGERKRGIERGDENYHVIERGYGRFDRRIDLPTSVKADSIKASSKNGVLTVRLPKLEEKKAGKVKVSLE